MEIRAPMELRGSGPISGPMGGGAFRFTGVGAIGFKRVYETVFFGAAAEVFFSFMAESVGDETDPRRIPFPAARKSFFLWLLFVLFYFSIVCAVFQPLKAKKTVKCLYGKKLRRTSATPLSTVPGTRFRGAGTPRPVIRIHGKTRKPIDF